MEDSSDVTTSAACLSPVVGLEAGEQSGPAGSSAAAAVYTAPLTPTQQKIRAILKVDAAEAVPTEALTALIGLEARQLPNDLSAGQIEPRNNPRTCCFDTANAPSAWAAHELCKRCALLNVVLQGESRAERA